MTVLVIIGIIVLVVIGGVLSKETRHKTPASYHYKRRDFIMTKAENDFFDVLNQAAGGEYYVFPQVHLSSILDHRVKGQNWQHALRCINQKSVDYVLCDKTYRRPLLAIELDDWSHEAEARRERDVNVEHMLQEAGIPLLRLKDVRQMGRGDVAQRIRSALL